MHQVEQEEPSQRFKRAWQVSGRHIQTCGQGGINWIRATLRSPMIEHLSFRIGNQLIFVFVEAAEFELNQWEERFL